MAAGAVSCRLPLVPAAGPATDVRVQRDGWYAPGETIMTVYFSLSSPAEKAMFGGEAACRAAACQAGGAAGHVAAARAERTNARRSTLHRGRAAGEQTETRR